jgi:hypothetical protein
MKQAQQPRELKMRRAFVYVEFFISPFFIGG